MTPDSVDKPTCSATTTSKPTSIPQGQGAATKTGTPYWDRLRFEYKSRGSIFNLQEPHGGYLDVVATFARP